MPVFSSALPREPIAIDLDFTAAADIACETSRTDPTIYAVAWRRYFPRPNIACRLWAVVDCFDYDPQRWQVDDNFKYRHGQRVQ